ncbi:MAG: AMP-binding protein [Candidatus Riflebacteria bacterium]|nr:AMP-binding protein [Candidatus Riflebacteria bacterium]
MKRWYFFGEFREAEAVDRSTIATVVERARQLGPKVSATPALKMLEVLDRVGQQLVDPAAPARRSLFDAVGPSFSPGESVEAGLDALAHLLHRESLSGLIETDLGGPPDLMDEFCWRPSSRGHTKIVPRGLLVHVFATTALLGTVDSLIRGIITKNVNVVLATGEELAFLLRFAELVARCDPAGPVSGCFAVVPCPGPAGSIEEPLATACDTVVVSGDRDVVSRCRARVGPGTRFIDQSSQDYWAVIDRVALAELGPDVVARRVARRLIDREPFCGAAAHTLFVDDGPLAHRLAGALRERLGELAAPVRQASTSPEPPPGTGSPPDWTVLELPDGAAPAVPRGKTVQVRTVPGHDRTAEIIASESSAVRSVGLVVPELKRFGLVNDLARTGASRFTDVCVASEPGQRVAFDVGCGLAGLVRWTTTEGRTPFVDEFDFRDDDHRDEMTLLRLNRLLATARSRSPFYRDRLPDRPLESLADLRQVPVLTSREFKDHLPPSGEGILSGPPGAAYAFASSGTTGTPKTVYRTVAETLHNARSLAKGLALSVLEPGDVVANLMFAGNLWASFVSFNQAFERCGCLILPIGGHLPMESIASYLQTYRPNVAISLPTVLLDLARHVEHHRLELKIEKIITGGEHLYAAGKEYIARVLGARRFASTGYKSNDTGAVGFQCRACEGAVHHLHEDLAYVEIVDPGTNEPMPDGEPGKVLVTNLHRMLMPMIRYDVGDMARRLRERCACGRKVRLMELLGRSDELLRVGMNLISLSSVAEAVCGVEGLSTQFRMVARQQGTVGLVIVEAESSHQADDAESRRLQAALLESLEALLPEELAEIRRSESAGVEVKVVAPGALPRNPRTGKIRQVVDERPVE